MPCPGPLHPEAMPLQQSTADMYLHRRYSNTVLSQSHGVSRSQCNKGLFKPSEYFWWVWGLILNAISPLLPSFWASPLPLDVGYLFLVGSNFLQSTVIQQRVVVLEFSKKMSTCPSALPSYFCFIDYAKAFDCVDHNKLENS